MRLSRKTKWCSVGTGGVVVLLFAAFLFWPFRFDYYSVCSLCGARQYTTEWQLPHSRQTLFDNSTVETTPLSRYLTSSGTVSNHSHAWLFGHGGGNGILCAIGAGDDIRGSVESPEVVRLLVFSKQYGDQGEASKFVRYILDRHMSRTMLRFAITVPTNGFSGREQYHSWIADQAEIIDDALEAAKQDR
jgi:hypothetical protein